MIRKLLLFALLFPLITFAQEVTVNGNVTDSLGLLVGVSILEKGTSNGTTTDIDGNYFIKVDQNATLVFSFLGYKSQEINISDKTTINAFLEEDASKLNEIVIRGFTNVIGQARRRAESIQNIPESVVTFTSEQIEATGISNLRNFAGQVPNFQFNTSQNAGVNFVTVRGIPQIRNGQAPIAFVIDGVTVPDANLLSQEQFDLAMIEIVKGPQGALYGKNAIAGAINIVTQQPTNKLKGKLLVGYSSGNTQKFQGAIAGPIIKDKFFFRASGSLKKSDGLFTNITLNQKPDYYDETNFRGQLIIKPSSNFKLTTSAQFNKFKGGGLYYHTSPTLNPIDPEGEFDGLAPTSNVLGKASLENFFGYLKGEFDFEKTKLQAVVSYNDSKRNGQGDLDHTAAVGLIQYQDSDSNVFNAELRLNSKLNNESKISWDLGTFYQRNERLLLTRAGAEGTDIFGAPLLNSDFTNTYNTFALFGFIDYKLTDKLTLSAGLRYDNDAIEQELRNISGDVIGTPSKNDSEIQPKFSIAYKANENILMFTNYGRGYRVGGFNAEQTALFDASYEAETSDSYEFGIKTNWLNNRFILNGALFYTKLNNQQQYGLSVVFPELYLGNYNYDESDITGFELDMKFRASKYLDILASYGYTKAEIKKGGIAGMLDTNADGTPDTPNDRNHLNGVNTPFVPQDGYSIGIQSNFPISDKIDFNGFINLKGTGKTYWHEEIINATTGNALPQVNSKAYSLLDLRLGITINKKMDVTLWGANILEQKYAQEYFSQNLGTGGVNQDLVWLGNPATYGVNLTYKF